MNKSSITIYTTFVNSAPRVGIASRTAVLEIFACSSQAATRGSNPYLYRRLKLKNTPFGNGMFFSFKAPRVGIEPTTNALTARCSTAELSRNMVELFMNFFINVVIIILEKDTFCKKPFVNTPFFKEKSLLKKK